MDKLYIYTTTYSGKAALVVKYMDNTIRFLGNQVYARFVVSVVDILPVDLLSHVFLLLELENVLVEVELKCLVRVLDAQLFKAVRCKVLKPNQYIILARSTEVNAIKITSKPKISKMAIEFRRSVSLQIMLFIFSTSHVKRRE